MHIKTVSLAIGLLFSLNTFALSSEEIKVANYFDSIKSQPEKLSRFLKAMPKGGDLHNHLSGAIYAESLLHYAKKDNFCINRSNFTVFADPQCESQNLLNNAIQEPFFYNMLIDSWSTRNFQPVNESAPDHFFATFSKYNPIVKIHQDQVLARVVKQAAVDHESYLELMVTTDGNQSGYLGKELGWDHDFQRMHDNLLFHNFEQILQSSNNLLNQIESSKNKIIGCDIDKTQPACTIEIRYLYQVSREQPPEMVFAQMLAGFEIAGQDKRVVGLNLVQPEHGKISVRDYSLQMQMMSFLHTLYPEVNFSLHAGELNEAVVAHKDLTFHINEAVNIAHALRIGHGVDILSERDLDQLLKTMSKKEILVEVNLSSNAFILDVKGVSHPLPLYLKSGVPVTLSTDDQGVNRSDLSKEYQLAVATFDFDYSTLKDFARNSLNYSFLEGKKLWLKNNYQQLTPECEQDDPKIETISSNCDTFLQNNKKAAMQWRLEKQFDSFEKLVINKMNE